jgi:hypothetical protein
VTDPDAFIPVRTGLALARALMQTHPDRWDSSRLARMVGRQDLVDALRNGQSLEEVEAMYAEDLARFVAERRRFVDDGG